MRCQKCDGEFEERDIELSHNVPCYLFEGKKRNIRKNQADKYERHNLCKQCHKNYELWLAFNLISTLSISTKKEMIPIADKLGKRYFKQKGEADDTKST